MKKLIIAALVLAAILLLAPNALGRFAEGRSNAMLDQMVEQTPYLTIVERSWERGWFRSRQQVTLQSLIPVDGVASPRFTLHNDVLHGPLLGLSGIGAARVKTRVDLPAELADSLRATFGPEPALDMTTRIGLLGGGSTVLTSRGRTLEPADGEAQVMYETAKLDIDFNRDISRYEIEGRMPRIEVRGRDGQLMVFDRLTLDVDAERLPQHAHIYDSRFELKLRQMEGSGPQGAYTIHDARYAGDMEADDGFIDMSFEVGSAGVSAVQLEATGIAIREVHYDFSLRNLHAPTLDAFYASMQQAYRSMPVTDETDPEATDEALREGFLAPMAEHAGALLQHDPQLTFDRVGVSTPEGDARLTGTVRVVGLTEQDFQAAGFAGVISRLQAEFTFVIDQALAEKIPGAAMMVDAGVQAGYLAREEDQLVARIEYRNGTLTVNGQTQAVPLPGMGPGVVPAPPQDFPDEGP